MLEYAESLEEFDNGNIEGSMHLEITQIKNQKDISEACDKEQENCVLMLNNGVTDVELRASSGAEQLKWKNAIV